MIDAPFSRTVLGSGGGSSKGQSARTPVVAPDTVKSKALLAILDLLCEGQIKGLVGNSSNSIYLDGTPLTNPDGSFNYQGFDWQFRDGRQDQTVMTGFPDVSTPYNVGVQIKQSTPQTITVSDPDADAVRVVISMPALSSQDVNSGDVSGTIVQYNFTMSVNGGAFVPVNVSGTTSSTVTINDKSRSKYQREHLINLPKPGTTYRIRVTRMTPDSASSYLANDTFLDSYYEILNSQLTYPNSVMCGVRVNSEQFASLPSRSYLVDGLLIRIPSNYNPETRVYTGVWDGSFSIGFSNNPAWVLYDLLINRRYGLGEFVKASNINVAKLYQIGRYCDGMLSNGFGGQEPRFTINTSIASRNDAYKVISDICSTFRGMSYWAGGMVQVTQDSPTDPVYLFNNANVVDGMFNRAGSARKDRHSVVHVQWNDPADQYKQKIEYVEDPDLIQSLGYKRMDTIAFGCTSRAQAHRVGLWILYTEKVETNITTFEVGLDGLVVVPGDIVKISDQWKAGKRNGGRLVAGSRTGCTLDKPTDIAAGSIIAIRMPDGKFEEKQVVQSGTGKTAITFASQLSVVPLANTVWILIEPSLVPVLGRVVGVAQSDTPNQFVISVVDHNPSKFSSIEQGLTLESLPTTILDPTFFTPESMKIEEVTYLVAPGQLGSRLDVSWVGKSPLYFVSYRVTKGTAVGGWQTTTTNKASFEVLNVLGGEVYDFKVVGQAVTGKLSSELVGTYVALGTKNPPAAPTNLTAVGDFRQINLAWINATVVDFDFVEIFENTVDNVNTAYYLDRTPGNTYTRSGIPGLMKYWYWVRTVNKRGMRSAFNSTAGTSATAGFIAKTDLDNALNTVIDDISTGLDDLAEEMQTITDGITGDLSEISEEMAGLDDRVEEAQALAAAARAGNSIEAMLRDDENVNIKQDTYTLRVELTDEIAAQVQAINTVATTDRQAVAQALTVVEARFGQNEASLVSEQTARASADSAQATSIAGLVSKTDTTNANLVIEQTTRANGDSANASLITALQSKTDTTNANLATELTTRATADTALASSITALTAKTTADISAAITTEQTVRANADSAMATNITNLVSKTDTTNANLTTEQTTRANADGALATSITALGTKTGDDIAAAIATEVTARTNADSAVASTVTALSTKVAGDISAAMTTEQTARSNADGALSTRIDNAVAANGTNSTAISSEVTARANADTALGVRIDQMVSKTDTTNAALTSEATTRANQDGALSTRIDTAQATANGATTSVQTTSTALSTLDGKLSSSWTAKVQTSSNGTIYMAGMGVGVQTTDQGIIQTQIAMQADRFTIINPGNSSQIVPFQVIGGIVLINAAYIGDMQSISLNAQGVPYWVLTRSGVFQLNGNGSGMRREMRANYDRYYNTSTGVLVIEIGELT